MSVASARGLKTSRAPDRHSATRPRRPRERTLRSSPLREHALQDDEQRHQIASRIHRCTSGSSRDRCRDRLEPAHERRRMRTHHLQQRLDRLQHARHAAKRQRRRAEADDFAVLWRLVSSDDVDRVGGRGDVIERAIQIVEPPACVRSRDRLAVCRELMTSLPRREKRLSR